MRQYIISEERLKMLLKHEKQLCYAQECVLYSPSEEELKVTDDDLKEFTEIKEHEFVPDIDFNPVHDKKRVSVEIVRTVKFKPNFSDINND